MYPCNGCGNYLKTKAALTLHRKSCQDCPEAHERYDCNKCNAVMEQWQKPKHIALHKKVGY